ncbi:hypothetical protein Tco_0871283 [Tanacetum coccineum]
MTLAQHGEAIRGIQEHLIEDDGGIETVLCNRMRDERQTRIEIERQLALVQESHRQDREEETQGVHD